MRLPNAQIQIWQPLRLASFQFVCLQVKVFLTWPPPHLVPLPPPPPSLSLFLEYRPTGLEKSSWDPDTHLRLNLTSDRLASHLLPVCIIQRVCLIFFYCQPVSDRGLCVWVSSEVEWSIVITQRRVAELRWAVLFAQVPNNVLLCTKPVPHCLTPYGGRHLLDP